jgi:mannose-6-phosphate isomerase-like protein (cupin superfamily)
MFNINSQLIKEYGVHANRFSKIFANMNAPFEMAYFIVKPGEKTDKHNHFEKEIFFCLEGKGICETDDRIFKFSKHNTWILMPYQNHVISNRGDNNTVLMAVWW